MDNTNDGMHTCGPTEDFKRRIRLVETKLARPEKSEIPCPICEQSMPLDVKKTEAFTKEGELIFCDQWVYQCQSCRIGFTTTESDQISFEEMQKILDNE